MRDILESMLNQICGANLFSSIYETLSVNLFSSGGAFGTAYNVVHAIYNTIMSIGVMLLFVYFIAGVGKSVVNRQASACGKPCGLPWKH